MMKGSYQLWLDYHKCPKKHYTDTEIKELQASEFAMHLLVPTDILTRLYGEKLEKFNELNTYQKSIAVKELAKLFCVDEEVVYIKIDVLNKMIKEKKTNDNTFIDKPKTKRRFLDIIKKSK